MVTSGGFIQACEQEQLHLSGAIQSYGALLIANKKTIQITHLSTNISDFISGFDEHSVGHLVPEILEGLIQNFNGTTQFYENELQGINSRLDVILNAVDEQHMAIELVPSLPHVRLQSAIKVLPPSIDSDAVLNSVRQQLVDYIAELTGFERVMYYEFLPSGDGEVIAECCQREGMGSYLGLRFPASDIPQIARNLYLKTPWRAIYDASAPTAAVMGHFTPDLTHSHLRSVSPIHIQYMRNMGVMSSVSWSIIGRNELSALLSIHDAEAKAIPLPVMQHLWEVIAQFNLMLREFAARKRVNLHARMQEQLNKLQVRINSAESFSDVWPQLSAWLMNEFKLQGVLLVHANEQFTAGTLKLEPHAFKQVQAKLLNSKEMLWQTDNLLGALPAIELSEVAGVAALNALPQSQQGFQLYLLRGCETYQISWGGRPDKPHEQQGELAISPRRSFEKWIETGLSFSMPWSEDTRLKLMKVRLLLQLLK
ncbi:MULTISPECIES: GAF domain-containing protein [Idiomarina]|uniref:GAF domain-containing protein n=1 Tax=Idiomarina TaxID=135575 RepID=UPI00129CCFC3|nr:MULTISPECIES: GAF domain-containing protein [Idiomarina]MRJ42660.1 GAF domain-containing protein [Idiomarina sp. FeN1]NCU57920.1 GAF domain-containing protein [Idiomarina sp. FenA--70]NCU60472.1 GAF domain-containing protein [Idiomarina sp. FenBw--71]UUN13563.1 GAF domain-containing protein [Idiomarina loihiensis]